MGLEFIRQDMDAANKLIKATPADAVTICQVACTFDARSVNAGDFGILTGQLGYVAGRVDRFGDIEPAHFSGTIEAFDPRTTHTYRLAVDIAARVSFLTGGDSPITVAVTFLTDGNGAPQNAEFPLTVLSEGAPRVIQGNGRFLFNPNTQGFTVYRLQIGPLVHQTLLDGSGVPI